MLVVLLKKTGYNTRVAVIDTKLSNLDGKITTKKMSLLKIQIILYYFFWEIWCLKLKMVLKLIYSFNHCIDILKRLVTNTNYILSWESKGLSAESIKLPTTYDNN